MLVIAIIGPCDGAAVAYSHDSRVKVEGADSGEGESSGVEVSEIYDADACL